MKHSASRVLQAPGVEPPSRPVPAFCTEEQNGGVRRSGFFQSGGTYLGDLEPREEREDFHRPQQDDSKTRLVAKVLRRDVLAGETFTHYADLVEALKCRCAQLRIGWSPDDISEALRVVGSNHPLVQPPSSAVVDVQPAREFSRAEAAELWGAIVGYFGPRAFKAMPARVPSAIRIDGPARDVVDIASIVSEAA